MRSPGSISRDMALSRVVLPEPVPPEMMTFSRAWAAICRIRATGRVIAPSSTSVAKSIRCLLNLRMEMYGPSSANGMNTMLTREPSFSRASTIGLDSSTRRPIALAMRWQMLARCMRVAEAYGGQSDLAASARRTPDPARSP